ncbi:Flp pilus assembly protein, pilin Flp [Burkholderia sp. Ch1-1]|uniref:Flp pilus assembly protein, pilin Flp n=1 Tax=Paraburkholderia dioscoreae TaxID=2604047 RepID=A0A5Q4ZN32_9BURK|nr:MULTISPECIES: Flp family type IVb pilin [Paraburkholderia]EIF34602.1 Flp pilus assembly protein, pilin Flp [Burkholderia sp. Ch1-1]MDR8395466.1 Flp family type IVb pilin [Paraburkholderia sp. USG1]VVD33549.1 Flp pilus assembly protein, pilin Flp [Paraburkholderia dioscoreae]
MKNTIQQFLREEDGVAAIEYGLLAGLIAVAIIATITTVGSKLNNVFTYVQNALNGVANPAGA